MKLKIKVFLNKRAKAKKIQQQQNCSKRLGKGNSSSKRRLYQMETWYIRNEERATKMMNRIHYSPSFEFFKMDLMAEAKIITVSVRVFKVCRYKR